MIHIKRIQINILINHAKSILKQAEQNLEILETMLYAFFYVYRAVYRDMFLY